ncbi:tetratricopeptide repeat protein [Tardiphaga robiniae]|uniref:Tetratricopeptide repeat protein n=1 Tax=Tardiphaga robiniae TaxID=943830 RepID=A0A7G6TUK7_9BRAD|nr:tetratricopeptide repeat protein [Tardiphaga robiniae]QND70439.1 tetratricopeptide repeat protein [Tardiphaga robiniae]
MITLACGTTALRSMVAVSLVALVLGGCGSPEDKAQGYYQRGIDLVAKNDDLAARVELLNALKYKSDKVEVWKALAGIDERTKASSLFLDLRRIVELDPNDLDARLKLAKLMLAGGATEAASKVIELAREGETPNSELHSLKAAVLARGNDLVGATREANRALSIDANNVDAASFIASRKLAEGDADGALKLLNGLPITSGNVPVRQLKVQVLARKGDLKAAEDIQRSIVAAVPKETAFRVQLVQLLVAQGKLDDAEKELRARIDADPGDRKAVLDLVRFLGGTKGAPGARAELEARIKAGGDVLDYQLSLSDIDIAQGKVDDALVLLKNLASSETAADRKNRAQLKLAETYVSRGNAAMADPIIAQILAADRRNVGALKLRALIKIDRGQIDDAIADLREALNDQPKASDLLMLMAVAHERGGKPELAERQYADAVRASNSSPGVVLQYVAFLQRKGDMDQTETILSDAASRNAGSLEILSPLAQLRLSRRNWSGARAVADLIAQNPSNRGLSEEVRAASFAGENRLEDSIAALENAHKFAPDAVDPVIALASAYVRQKQPEKAAVLLQEMTKKHPANAQLLVLSGRIKLEQNKDDQALQDFKAAVHQQPKNPIGYAALSDLYSRRKNYGAAIEAIQSGLQEQPQNVNLQMALGGLQIQKGNPDAAIEQYEAVLKGQPQQALAINNLVSLLIDRDLDKVTTDRVVSLAEVLKASPIPEFQDTYGWVQYKRGDYPAAIGFLEKAAAQIGRQSGVRYHLGMAYKAVGETAKATEQFKLAIQSETEDTPLKVKIREALRDISSK